MVGIARRKGVTRSLAALLAERDQKLAPESNNLISESGRVIIMGAQRPVGEGSEPRTQTVAVTGW